MALIPDQLKDQFFEVERRAGLTPVEHYGGHDGRVIAGAAIREHLQEAEIVAAASAKEQPPSLFDEPIEAPVHGVLPVAGGKRYSADQTWPAGMPKQVTIVRR